VDRRVHDDLGDPVRALWTLPLVAATIGFGWSAAHSPAQTDTEPRIVSGAELYATQCSACHGPDGGGVTDRGPDIREDGRAAVDFVLRTGRMPMADPAAQASRGPVRYTEAQILALVDYVGDFGNGPDTPTVEITDADVARGGDLYRLNCAACHVASGAGAAIGGGRNAPSLMAATPTQIGQAIIVGPGAMPAFDSFSPDYIDDVAAYVVALQESDADGVNSFGGAGPVAEGLAAWLLGLLPLVALSRWIGSPHEGRNHGAGTENG
jgi:quinol---cytochrome-c reductase cytochrome c subunit